jgi:hypothetical protein
MAYSEVTALSPHLRPTFWSEIASSFPTDIQ